LLDTFFPLYAIVFLLSLFITVFLEKKLIPALKRKASQPIYADGPKWHQKKSGTPTFGGIGFIVAILISLSLAMPFLLNGRGVKSLISFVLTLGFALLNALVGVLDDLTKLKKRENQGLTPSEKLFAQFFISALYLFSRYIFLNENGTVSFSFGEVNLGFFYYPVTVIILIGIINCANLTDGIDGLATSVAFSVGVVLLFISAALVEEVALISSALIGVSVGFLVFNLHPAKIFMGDTGSLFFGALTSGCAVALGNPLIALFVGGVYVIEGVSVILQVIAYKLTGKRIFKMAPLHHHLEQCGFSENKICIIAILLSFIFAIPTYIFYLP